MIKMQTEFRVRSSMAVLALGLSAAALPQASAQGIYMCVDAEGRKTLTDVNRAGCKTLVPSVIASEPVAAPRRAASPGPIRLASVAPKASAPADFPRIDSAQQKARDDDRRGILHEELRSEERKLADLLKEFNNGEPERQGNERNYAKYQERVAAMRDNIGRAEKNIQALRREIASIK
jgi:hypothetical protein